MGVAADADDYPAGKADGGDVTRRKHAAPNRQGPLSAQEHAIVAAFVEEQPGPVTTQQANDLAAAMRRTPAAVKRMIEEARADFASKAGRYVTIHAEATEAALKSGTVTGLDTALRGAQWAIERMAADGARVIDKPSAGSGGSKILIGIQVGGIGPVATTAVSVPAPEDD